ncbi:hypothetical protein BST83_18770 [Polaribacter filamentus]|uniref:Spi protease inhibitor domain-containing protein n=1 Tax=Polaribacter filamentus TaxID=53483 RepID=A0A2S7KL69_9FLAO|nr:C10 family peptidase [Polaribacter filamentus]PQB03341.1 hypothetical protein BST83_18770 [Polaribacter filamentus]
MKKNKLINGLKLVFAITLLSFYSCDNEPIDGELNSNSNQIIQGTEITEEVAKEVALIFFNKTYKSQNYLQKNSTQTKTTISSIETIKDYNSKTGIYIVNMEPEGFVLVTSNSKNVPIAAHSETGAFEFNENSPDGLKSWIAENIVFNDILEAREPIEEVEKQWYYVMPFPDDDTNPDDDGETGSGNNSNSNARYSHTVNEQVGPLMQTTWGQNFPYNNFTPNNNPTGCVAVATAQIMHYHEWPNNFNWAGMPNRPFTTNTGLEIASLMSDIGINVNMNYSASSSGADSEDAKNSLINDYGYSSTATYSSYNFSTVKQEIYMYNRPVYMDGYHSFETSGTWFWKQTSYQDGHAWVCDGYKQQYDLYIYNEGTTYEYTQQENRYEWLHMNWGWNNAGNGWFYKNHLWVNGVNILVDGNAVNPNFQYNRECIYRIKP